MSKVTFIEPFCGSAAVSYGLLGARRLAPYMGSKLRYVKQLLELMQLAPEALEAVILLDSGEWGRTLNTFHERDLADAVAAMIDQWGSARKAAMDAGEDVRYWTDDRELYDQLVGAAYLPLATPTARAAAHLFLQVRAFNGKSVSVRRGAWHSHGFDPEYRDSKPGAKSNRGWATPRWKLAERIRKNIEPLSQVEILVRQWDHSVSRCPLLWEEAVGEPRVVYMDPPYAGTTAYPHAFGREKVLAMARDQYALGNTSVYVSEAEPLADLVAEGWEAVALVAPGQGKRAWQVSKVKEWVTFRRSRP